MSNPSPLSQRKCLLWILSLSRSLHSSFVSLLPRQSTRTPPTSFLINCTSLSSLSFSFRMLCMTSPLPSLVVVCSRLVRFRIPSGTFLLLGSIFLNISSFLLTASQVTHLFRRFRFSALCSLFTAARSLYEELPSHQYHHQTMSTEEIESAPSASTSTSQWVSHQSQCINQPLNWSRRRMLFAEPVTLIPSNLLLSFSPSDFTILQASSH